MKSLSELEPNPDGRDVERQIHDVRQDGSSVAHHDSGYRPEEMPSQKDHEYPRGLSRPSGCSEQQRPQKEQRAPAGLGKKFYDPACARHAQTGLTGKAGSAAVANRSGGHDFFLSKTGSSVPGAARWATARLLRRRDLRPGRISASPSERRRVPSDGSD